MGKKKKAGVRSPFYRNTDSCSVSAGMFLRLSHAVIVTNTKKL